MSRLRARLERRWYSQAPPPLALRPLAALYGLIAARRRTRLQAQAASLKLPLPVIVVGNISLGGTGKTPLVIWLVEHLREWGFSPGIVSRGYGGRAAAYPLRLNEQTLPAEAGDEPVLLFRRLRCPLAVAPDRVAAARLLIESGEVDVLVADDGLQHYRLPRDLEICVVDGRRLFGNGALLPAGPLREPVSRLDEVDLVVVNGEPAMALQAQPSAIMRLQIETAVQLVDGQRRALASFAGTTVHAVAGIGNPQRYFDQLRAAGLSVQEHAFPDHHAFQPADLAYGDGLPLLMTEKDAVKCLSYAQAGWWAVPAEAALEPSATALVRELCLNLKR